MPTLVTLVSVPRFHFALSFQLSPWVFLPFVCVLNLASQAEHSCLLQMPCKWMLHDGHRHGSHLFLITHRPYPENAHHSSGTSDHMYTMHGAHAMQRPEIGILVFFSEFVCILQSFGWRLRPYSHPGLITNAHNQARASGEG